MQPWGSRTLSQPVHRHIGQASSGHQPGQIRLGTGQELHALNSPQGWPAHFPETIYPTWGTHTVHRTKPRQIAQARSGTAIQLWIQFTHLLRTQKTRLRTPDSARLPVTKPTFPHWQILNERNQQMHRGHWTSEFVHFHKSGSHFRILANETAPGITAIDRIHHPPLGAITLDHFTYGTTGVPGKLCVGKANPYWEKYDFSQHGLAFPNQANYCTNNKPPLSHLVFWWETQLGESRVSLFLPHLRATSDKNVLKRYFCDLF